MLSVVILCVFSYIPSDTICSIVFPNILVSQIPSGLSFIFPFIYSIRSSAWFLFPTIGAISTIISVLSRLIDGTLAFILTPYLLPFLITTGSSSCIFSFEGVTTPKPLRLTSLIASPKLPSSFFLSERDLIISISSCSLLICVPVSSLNIL